MKCLLASVLLATLLAAAPASPAKADPANYGIESTEAAVSTGKASAHPDLTGGSGLQPRPVRLDRHKQQQQCDRLSTGRAGGHHRN